MLRLLMIAAALLVAGAAPLPEPGGEPIVIGRAYDLPSRTLGDTRRINVWLPPSYAAGDKRYPVLVLIDGGVDEDFLHIAGLAQITAAYGRGREMIVVGVAGVDRRHDLSPPTSDPADRDVTKRPGGAAAYRRFLGEELKPWLAARFRTDGRHAIIGESMAGLFILDTFAAAPGAFDDFIAVSPSLWWDRGALSKRIAATPPALPAGSRLFIAFEGNLTPPPGGPTVAQQAEARVAAALQGRPGVILTRFADERHDTIYHPAALAAFRTLYPVAPAR